MNVNYNFEITKEDIVKLKVEEHRKELQATLDSIDKGIEKLDRQFKKLWKEFVADLKPRIEEQAGSLVKLLAENAGLPFHLVAVAPTAQYKSGEWYDVERVHNFESQNFGAFKNKITGSFYAIYSPLKSTVHWWIIPVKVKMDIDYTIFDEVIDAQTLMHQKIKNEHYMDKHRLLRNRERDYETEMYWKEFEEKIHNDVVKELMKASPLPSSHPILPMVSEENQ